MRRVVISFDGITPLNPSSSVVLVMQEWTNCVDATSEAVSAASHDRASLEAEKGDIEPDLRPRPLSTENRDAVSEL